MNTGTWFHSQPGANPPRTAATPQHHPPFEIHLKHTTPEHAHGTLPFSYRQSTSHRAQEIEEPRTSIKLNPTSAF